MVEDIIKMVDNFIEDCKDKEYVCYYNDRTSNRYDKFLFTKKQLIEFINENQLDKLEVYKITDRIQIERELRIKEKGDTK